MTKQLLKQIALMCYWITLGIICWVTAPHISKIWLMIICVTFAFISFIVAWVHYRQAKRISEDIDNNPTLTLTIIHHGEESESKGKAKGQAENEVQSGTDRENESEDNRSLANQR